ncbi:MAG: trimethylamine methyltransferase, partial [Thermoproteota archaeon]
MKRGPKGGLLAPLSLAELDSIHLATLEVLERVGIKCGSKLALEEYRKAGAEVEGDRVKIPQHLVEEALRKAPRQVLLCGRLRENDILLEGSRVYFGLGGTPTPYIRDLETGEIRRPTARDMAEATKLGDALENIDFIMSIAGAFDVPYQLEYVVEFKTLFENTSKPIVYSAPGKVNAELVLEMAAAIAGGLDELRRRPILSLYSETASPLTFTRENEN